MFGKPTAQQTDLTFALEPKEQQAAAYEVLWTQPNSSLAQLVATLVAKKQQELAACVPLLQRQHCLRTLAPLLMRKTVDCAYTPQVHYPQGLLSGHYRYPFLYFRGHWPLLGRNTLTIVGPQSLSSAASFRVQALTRWCVKQNLTPLAMVAQGTANLVHRTALLAAGKSIAVLDVPFNQIAPPKHEALCELLPQSGLVLSHVPFLRYNQLNATQQGEFLLETIRLMAALSDATLIIEPDKEGLALLHARAALAEQHKLFLLEPCFQHTARWPSRLLQEGAVRLRRWQNLVT